MYCMGKCGNLYIENLILYITEKFFGFFFFHGLLYIQDLDFYFLVAERDGNDISLFDIGGCLCRLIIDQHSAAVAGFISHSTALDQSGYLQIFV